jgi:hypothetical protein
MEQLDETRAALERINRLLVESLRREFEMQLVLRRWFRRGGEQKVAP